MPSAVDDAILTWTVRGIPQISINPVWLNSPQRHNVPEGRKEKMLKLRGERRVSHRVI